MDWLLLCPPCCCVVESFRGLSGVHNSYHCNACQTDYEAELDDLIAITFTVAPGVGAELRPFDIEPRTASLKGIHQEVRVFRIPPSSAMN